jgi:DNA-cytosine methyltransferase
MNRSVDRIRANGHRDGRPRWQEDGVWLIEDDAARSTRQRLPGVSARTTAPGVTIQLHRIGPQGPETIEKCAVERSPRAARVDRVDHALRMVDRALRHGRPGLVVAGSGYGSSAAFLCGLQARELDFAVELRPATYVRPLNGMPGGAKPIQAAAKIARVRWNEFCVSSPVSDEPLAFAIADLGRAALGRSSGRLFAAQTGGIQGVHRGTIIGLHSRPHRELRAIVEAVGWARWIRPVTRRRERAIRPNAAAEDSGLIVLKARANIAIADNIDATSAEHNDLVLAALRARKGALTKAARVLNVAELFAGAGGMGLGFLLAGQPRARYRLVCSAEVNPVYVETLRRNHRAFADQRRSSCGLVADTTAPLDLRTDRAMDRIRWCARQHGGLHLVIGGPPCQGFSTANRNSWHSDNPHNRLVGVFANCVRRLEPLVFLLENVQGVLWTCSAGRGRLRLSVAERVAKQFADAGYLTFPKLLDAAWYGVPQYRSRFFLMGIRSDLGYRQDDFGEWGPFPAPSNGPGAERPYVTVREAISDLPPIGNGQRQSEMPYAGPSSPVLRTNPFLALMRVGAPNESISDHVTSRQADYVVARYRRIPPGGNWQAIADTMTNYADVSRTHSNIYRRLEWDRPSITIGHYRKSMLVHPRQHRGLSLREASRLQSFPDWFRFAGTADGREGGLMHKQQQLANAVCPLVTKALAEFILLL